MVLFLFMGAEQEQAPTAGEAPSESAQILQSLKDLEAGQKRLQDRLEAITREGGTITTLTNIVLKVGQDVSETKGAVDKRIETLAQKLHPVSKVERAVLVVGAVAITNLALRLLSVGTLPAEGSRSRSMLQTFAYYLSP